jgi:hypothetical protein
VKDRAKQSSSSWYQSLNGNAYCAVQPPGPQQSFPKRAGPRAHSLHARVPLAILANKESKRKTRVWITHLLMRFGKERKRIGHHVVEKKESDHVEVCYGSVLVDEKKDTRIQ